MNPSTLAEFGWKFWWQLCGGRMKRRITIKNLVVGIVGAITLGVQFVGFALPISAMATTTAVTSKVLIGGDIHTLTIRGSQMIITGHEHAAFSTDFAMNWKVMSALDGSDIMAWATNSTRTFAGGHNGLFESSLNKYDFKRVNFYKDISDVHALGASGKFVYLASPQFGLLVSENSGKTWIPRNTRIGQGFMGSMLVDPKDPQRILAPDMQAGLLSSSDGGKTWKSLGGPMGTMSIAWNPKNISEIAVIGMSGAAVTKNKGKTWTSISIPSGASAIQYSVDGKTLYAASLVAPYAHIFISRDNGNSWSMSIRSGTETKPLSSHMNSLPPAPMKSTSGMDPNMPGMAKNTAYNHDDTQSANRPLRAVLGIFGMASTLVMSSAFVLRRKDMKKRALKESQRSRGRHSKSITSTEV